MVTRGTQPNPSRERWGGSVVPTVIDAAAARWQGAFPARSRAGRCLALVMTRSIDLECEGSTSFEAEAWCPGMDTTLQIGLILIAWGWMREPYVTM